MTNLTWPPEAARYPDDSVRRFAASGSNIALDFHGDPATAGLAVFSDGNHHMALEAVVRAFVAANANIGDVFYTTTPPAPLVDALKGGGLALGNLHISRRPDVFIGPANILEGLLAAGLVTEHEPFAQSRGNVVLVRKGNPKRIESLADLLSDDVTLTCSNPATERASYQVYRETATVLAPRDGVDPEAIVTKLEVAGPRTVHSQAIHHREVPELIGSGAADAAVIYYHLALRYARIFPDVFEFVDIDGVESNQTSPGHPTTRYHVGLVTGGRTPGSAFYRFIRDDVAQSLYVDHGLTRLH